MNDYKKRVVVQNQESIYADVYDDILVEDIATHLLSKGILSSYERDQISKQQKGGTYKIATLLKLLLQKSDGRWFEEFIAVLSETHDWISKKLSEQFYNEKENKLMYYLGGRGHVPPLPHYHVTREEMVTKLRQKIQNLRRDYYLVVHGLSGSGKTCLVADALQDIQLLEEHLGGYIYWLSVGDIKEDEPDNLICQQLLKKLCDMVDMNINLQKDLFVQLKAHFSVPPNKSALLVLDKVRSCKVIDALSVGCKILVTTQDADVVKTDRKHFFPVNEGFTEAESVQLLTDFVINGQERNLSNFGESPAFRESAINIHHTWRGHPMAIGLIGGRLSEFREDIEMNASTWKKFAPSNNNIKNGSDTRRRSAVLAEMSIIIDETVNKLNKDIQNLFYMLAVLMEGTNITSTVLQILWEKSEDEVRNIMNILYKRSLVVKLFNTSLRASVYGIHDIIMEYLRKKLSEPEIKNLQKGLLLKYFKACDGKFSSLPQDSYIFSYICHHVDCASMWDEYRDQFFSLHYIKSKLRATGPGDLILDLHKYHYGLTGNGNDKYASKIEDIRRFVECSGWDIYKDEIDVVQCALLQSEPSYIHETAKDMLNDSNFSGRVYFYPTKDSWKRPRNLEMKIPNVKSVKLILSPCANNTNGCVLINSSKTNLIRELDMYYKKDRFVFQESNYVEFIEMSPTGNRFLSALDNGTINVWSLESKADTPPPRLRQENFLAHFINSETRTTPSLSFKHNRKVTDACFSSSGNRVVSASEDGTLQVRNLEEWNKPLWSKDVLPNPHALSCTFMKEDEVVYACKNNKIFFETLDANQQYHMELNYHRGSVVSLFPAVDGGRKLIVVQTKAVILYSWEDRVLEHKKEGQRKHKLEGLRELELYNEESASVLCAAYDKEEHHLLLGTSQGCIIIYDVLNNNFKSQRLCHGEVRAVDLARSQIMFTLNDCLKVYWPEKNQQVDVGGLPSSAHLGWMKENVSVYAIASSTGNIQVYHDGKLFAEKFVPNPCLVHVTSQGCNIFIATSDGIVYMLDTISKRLTRMHELFQNKISFLSSIKYFCRGMENVCLVVSAHSLDEAGERGSIRLLVDLNVMSTSKPFSQKIDADVVKAFICAESQFLVVVLRNYSILACSLPERGQNLNLYCIQEGRLSAQVTDAYLSDCEKLLVLTDQENCFHIVSLKWSGDKDKINNINVLNNLVSERKPLRLPLTSDISHSRHLQNNSNDVVDGLGMSSHCIPPELKCTLDTRPIHAPSFCCCCCAKGNFIAIGHGDLEVTIFNVAKKTTIKFSILVDRCTRVSQLQFSPYDVKLGGNRFRLILLVVTDCLSLWDLSYMVEGCKGDPKRIGCVNAGGNPIISTSVCPSFDKFSAYDSHFSYFSWDVWSKNIED